MIEIPPELMRPTLEELEERTAKDLAVKWKPCKRPGKRERQAIKREKEAARLREIANEFDKQKTKLASVKEGLGTLFVNKNEKSSFSLADLNSSSSANAKLVERPALRVAFGKPPESSSASSQPIVRKRGRPAKLSGL